MITAKRQSRACRREKVRYFFRGKKRGFAAGGEESNPPFRPLCGGELQVLQDDVRDDQDDNRAGEPPLPAHFGSHFGLESDEVGDIGFNFAQADFDVTDVGFYFAQASFGVGIFGFDVGVFAFDLGDFGGGGGAFYALLYHLRDGFGGFFFYAAGAQFAGEIQRVNCRRGHCGRDCSALLREASSFCEAAVWLFAACFFTFAFSPSAVCRLPFAARKTPLAKKHRHSRESGNHFLFAAKPPNLRGYAAWGQRFPLIKGMTAFFNSPFFLPLAFRRRFLYPALRAAPSRGGEGGLNCVGLRG
jgi:hypothetical protein